MRKKEEFYENDFYEDKEELELMDLFFTLVRRRKVIALIAIPIFVLGVCFAMIKPTVYKAEMTMMVSNGRNFNMSSLDSGELSVNQKLATTYAEIAKGKVILNNVIRKYDLDTTLKKLQNNVTITLIDDTELLQLTYKNEDATLAAAVVNEIGNEFILKVREVMNLQNIKVVESAEIPKEALPKKRALIIVISGVLSIIMGCMVAFIVERFFCKLRKPKDIEKILGTSMLGMVPGFDFSSIDGAKDKNKTKRQLFFKDADDHEMNEATRIIRTNLHFLNEKESERTMLITSTTPKEGKSTIASNYAMSIAITGKKVLLIDCDIRRPRAHESFGVSFNSGLESVLSGKCAVKDVILREVEKNLDILPTINVAHNVTELFLGGKMKELLQELKGKYNTIVLDTPPLIVASDAAILSKYCDGVVYVVAYDQVAKRELEFGKTMLNNAKANIYGFIVNKVDKNGLSYGNYGYYNNNYSYYKDYYTEEGGTFVRVHKSQKSVKGFIEKLKRDYKRQLSGDQKGKRW